MNPTILKLKEAGCNVDSAMERFLNDEDFLVECVIQVLRDDNFEKLTRAVASQDVRAAFEASHTLKGIIANTELTPLYGPIVAIVEPLREGSFVEVEGNLNVLEEKRQLIVKAISM